MKGRMMSTFMFLTVIVLLIVCSVSLVTAAESVKMQEVQTVTNFQYQPMSTPGLKQDLDSDQPQECCFQSFRNKLGFEVSTGIQGIFSFFQLGILFPRINDTLFVDLKVRYMSSLTWATYIDQDKNAVSFHPAVIGGAVSFGGYSPLLYNCVRMYGGMELFLGYSFTPYDSYLLQTGNLIGDNLTYALLGFFGLELFTSEHIALILDAGGGLKNIFGDKSNQYTIASSWLGSGFGIKMGVRYYL
jgi:hypothetical protein